VQYDDFLSNDNLEGKFIDNDVIDKCTVIQRFVSDLLASSNSVDLLNFKISRDKGSMLDMCV